MTRRDTKAITVACDGHGCREKALIPDPSPARLPDGWLSLDVNDAAFHAEPCLVGYITLLGVTRRDGSGLVVGQAADYGVWFRTGDTTPEEPKA